MRSQRSHSTYINSEKQDVQNLDPASLVHTAQVITGGVIMVLLRSLNIIVVLSAFSYGAAVPLDTVHARDVCQHLTGIVAREPYWDSIKDTFNNLKEKVGKLVSSDGEGGLLGGGLSNVSSIMKHFDEASSVLKYLDGF